MAQELPLEILLALQHSGITKDYRSVGSLLCASKGLQQAAVRLSASQLSVELKHTWSEVKGRSFAAFARKFGTLLGDITFNIAGPRQLTPIAAEPIAALIDAAQQPQGLQIRSLTINAPTEPLMDLIPLLRQTLTRLKLEYFYDMEDRGDHLVAATEVALATLTNLRSLSLGVYVFDGAENGEAPLLRPLSQLSSLTALTAFGLAGPQDLRHLPTNLQELHFEYREQMHYADEQRRESIMDPVLKLSHLTAVTKLGTLEFGDGHTLESPDVLPNHLRQATFDNIRSVQPVLKLTNLQELNVLCATTPASELEQLRALSKLTSLSLAFGSRMDAWYMRHSKPTENPLVERLKAITAVPVTALKLGPIEDGTLGVASLTILGELTGLTALTLTNCRLGGSDCIAAVATALSQLTGLQHLVVDRLLFDTCQLKYKLIQEEDDTLLLCQAISTLKQLRSLWIHEMPMAAGSALQLQGLATANQLTHLALRACRLTRATLAPL